ncbi:MAG: ArnT family glycosyltransferase, partial [Caulobacteraceae bacterium]
MSALTSASGRRLSLERLSPAASLALLIGATLAARLLVAALVPLTADEAYYRLWSLKPAFGYFDHPPMIAWWIWLGRHLAGDTPFGVRLAPTLSVAVTTLLTFDLARQANLSERAAVRAAVWLNATFLIGLGGEMAVPDAPNALFFTAALCCAFRAMKGRPAWWLAAGAAAGLACLSKYSALFLAPGVLLWLGATRDGRKALATPWPWLAAVVAVAFYAPNVAWNAEHGWATFIKQFGRVAPSALEPKYLVKFPVDQFFLINPLIAVFVVQAVRRRATPRLLLVCAPFVGYLVIHSLHGEVQGQWPAPLYPALVIAAAAAAEKAKGWLTRVRTAAAPVGFCVCAAIFAFMVAPSPAWLPMRDPARAIRGWPQFLASVETVRDRTGAAWVGALNYGLAAQFADASEIHAPATEIFERERFTFEVPAERADFSRPGLVVADVRDGVEGAVRRCFA